MAALKANEGAVRQLMLDELECFRRTVFNFDSILEEDHKIIPSQLYEQPTDKLNELIRYFEAR